jgi:hypothetical protein
MSFLEFMEEFPNVSVITENNHHACNNPAILKITSPLQLTAVLPSLHEQEVEMLGMSTPSESKSAVINRQLKQQ